jgi:serine/threonine protein phosphatase PrpC
MSTTVGTIIAAGATDAGLLREVNEDRFFVDEARGIFIVVDGIGGQAAGGKAADVALSMLRQRLERETGPVCERVREAIAIANNEIYRLASTRPEWAGMACVLTVAVVKDGHATIGHVGDTRLYKIRAGLPRAESRGRIEKITHDHSPVGEREDANEISERDAMHHPRRNEVYRDVGSEPHAPSDPDFVEVHEIPLEADEALLLCSDGLTDLVDSASILRAVTQYAGIPDAVVRALIDAANAAGGKDNVTAVYVEGGTFASGVASRLPGTTGQPAERPQREASQPSQPAAVPIAGRPNGSTLPRQLGLIGAIVVSLVMTGFIVYRTAPISLPTPLLPDLVSATEATRVVRPGESIAAAVKLAQAGTEVIVEPGEYHERVTLNNNIRLVSRVPRGATIRLPATTSDVQPEPAVVATGSSGGELRGFKIVGDARTPLGVGVLVSGSGLSLVDIDVSGAATAAISFARDAKATLVGGEIHDNPGAALAVAPGASPRITHSVFSRNGTSQRTPATFAIEKGATPLFERNVFIGVRADVFATIDQTSRNALTRDNWFH